MSFSIVCALMAMLCWAVNNFLLSVVSKETSNPADANLSGTFVLWASTGVCSIPLLAFQGATTGVLKDIHGKRNIIGAFVAGLFSSAGMLVLSEAFASDPNSAGPITAVLPLNGLLVSGLAWFVLGERLSAKQFLGIVISILGPMLMALADKSDGALKGVAYGGVAACLLGISNFLRKFVFIRGIKNPTNVQLLVWLATASCGVISILGVYASGRQLKGLDSPRLVAFAAISGLIWAIGSLCFQLALRGPAGPATAIANTNSAGVLLLQIVVYHPQIPHLKIFGMGMCVIGAAIISLSPKPKQQEPLVAELFANSRDEQP